MKLLIVSGGGGHFAPALAVIEALPKDTEVLLVGRKHGFEGDKALSLEYTVAKEYGIAFKAITTGRVQRHFSRHAVSSLLKVPIGFWQSYQILSSFKPDVVLSFGGYTAVPVILAAKMLNIPIVIHEQTKRAGLANKFGARFAKYVCVSWESSKDFFPKEKVVLTGIPLRKAITHPEKSSRLENIPEDRLLLYVTGGSLGSHAINVLVKSCLGTLLEKFYIIHQTGDAKAHNDFTMLSDYRKTLPEKLQDKYFLTKFIDPNEQGATLSRADVVLSRAGANTVSELIYYHKPCVLIPLPFAQENEQEENAKLLVAEGVGIILRQEDATPQTLFDALMHAHSKKSEFPKDSVFKDSAKEILAVVKKAIYD